MHFIYFLYIFYILDILSIRSPWRLTHSRTTLVLALLDISAIHHQTKMQSTKYKCYTVYITRSAVKSACSAQTGTGRPRPGDHPGGYCCNVYRQEFNCLHVTERISVSLNPPPPLERARWLSDLGYSLLQALMALGYIPRGYFNPLLRLSAKACVFFLLWNKGM